jgi:hypothetical protein
MLQALRVVRGLLCGHGLGSFLCAHARERATPDEPSTLRATNPQWCPQLRERLTRIRERTAGIEGHVARVQVRPARIQDRLARADVPAAGSSARRLSPSRRRPRVARKVMSTVNQAPCSGMDSYAVVSAE